jgi:hypothetical protein
MALHIIGLAATPRGTEEEAVALALMTGCAVGERCVASSVADSRSERPRKKLLWQRFPLEWTSEPPGFTIHHGRR